MTSLVVARSFYYQEAAITWLFSSPEEQFYIEGYLTVTLRHKSDRWLFFVKSAFSVSRVELSGILYRGVFFPRDLMVRIVSAEVLRRTTQRAQDKYRHLHGSVGMTAAGTWLN